MRHPKIKFAEIEGIFSKSEMRSGNKCERLLKTVIERSLSDYYAQDFSREFLWAFDPIATWQIANYHYRQIRAEVDKNTVLWLRQVSFKEDEAIVCYAKLRRLFNRLTDYRRLLAETRWYDWKLRSVLKSAIAKIEAASVDLLELLNVVAYLSRHKLWGGHELIAKMTA